MRSTARCMFLVGLLLFVSAAGARADTILYAIQLTPDALVPPRAESFTGFAQTGVQPQAGRIDSTVSVDLGTEFELHLHEGPIGSNGPRLGTFVRTNGDVGSGVFELEDVDASAMALITGGFAYLLVTTTEDPDGILRGQFTGDVVSDGVSSFGAVEAELRRD